MWRLVLHSVLTLLVASCANDGPITSSKQAIIDGTEAQPGELPAVGALLRGESQTVLCSATLIANRFALTAAHCLERVASDEALGFFIGTNGRTPPPEQVIEAAGRFMHPDYDGSSVPDTLAVYHDIALVELVTPAAGVVPMKLVRPSETAALIKSDRGVLLVGFGADEMGGQRGIKRTGTTRIGEVGEGEFWIWGEPKPQKCSGDSGGPTFGDLDEGEGMDLRLIGVASRAGQDCEGGSAETRTDIHLQWIREIIGEALPCGSGDSEDCPSPGDTAAGEGCTRHRACRDGICVLGKSGGYCSGRCDSETSCVSGFSCHLQRGVCLRDEVPGLDAGVDVIDAGSDGERNGDGGCSVSRARTPLLLLLLGLIFMRARSGSQPIR